MQEVGRLVPGQSIDLEADSLGAVAAITLPQKTLEASTTWLQIQKVGLLNVIFLLWRLSQPTS